MGNKIKEVFTIFYQTYSKSMNYFTRDIMEDHSKGAHTWDVNGKEYIDFTRALGPGLVGDCDERINTAITKQLAKGISFSTPTAIEQELCEKLIEIIPGCEACKLMKNGEDVTTAAVKLARAYTGRDIILKAGYHGWADWSISTEPGAKGIPKAVKELSKKFQYNDIWDLAFTIMHNPLNIAAVILEPIMENGPKPGYLEALRELCNRYGIVLIFDEIVSGFRTALGGAAEYYNVTPDIMCVGKAMGGGMPISAVCGRKDILSLIDSGECFISTTFGGECLSIAAALACIEILEEKGTYPHIWSLGQMMLDGLQASIDYWNLHDCISTTGLPPHCGLSFKDIGSLDYLDLLSIYEEQMMDNGIITSDTSFISLSHSEADISHFIKSANEAMQKISIAIQNNSTKGILIGRKISPVFRRH